MSAIGTPHQVVFEVVNHTSCLLKPWSLSGFVHRGTQEEGPTAVDAGATGSGGTFKGASTSDPGAAAMVGFQVFTPGKHFFVIMLASSDPNYSPDRGNFIRIWSDDVEPTLDAAMWEKVVRGNHYAALDSRVGRLNVDSHVETTGITMKATVDVKWTLT